MGDKGLRFISLFSGIEAASSAWLPLGWICAAVAEVDGFCCQLLKRKYPDVPNLGDVTAITELQIQDLGPVGVVIFGSPCQDLSLAGKRAGLAGERSGLFFDAMRIVRWSGARFALWENVPGAFSSNGGADFALVLGEMAGVCVDVPDGGWRNTGVLLGPAGLVEWAVLDAQWFGVPQRRRRIFVIRDSGDWANRPPILFDTESLSGNSAPRRKTREDVTGSLAARTNSGGGLGTDFDLGGGYSLSPALTGSGRGTERAGDSRGQDCVIPLTAYALNGKGGSGRMECDAETLIASTGETSHCLNAVGMGRIDYETETMVIGSLTTKHTPNGHGMCGVNIDEASAGQLIPIAFSCKDSGADAGELSPTLRAMEFDGSHANGCGRAAIAFQSSQSGVRECAAHATLDSNNGSRRHNGVIQGAAVRRLTPLECERLQGFPDRHTDIGRADGPRYKALGNSMAVPVIQWIGHRIIASYPSEIARTG